MSKIKNGKLFRSIFPSGNINNNFDASQINRIYKRLAKLTGVDDNVRRNISNHSTRVGAAQDLLSTGCKFMKILNRTHILF